MVQRLSVLDQTIAAAGQPAHVAIRNTVALAQHCERLGYTRFWVSEHHNHPTILGTAPEILISAIAATTSRIRVGSAGIMLPHYAPFKVAEQFRVLDALAPGRIDLGLGRAPGSDGLTAFALHPLANERPAQFPADVRDLLAWVSGAPLADGHPFAAVKAHPMSDTVPETWILGSSTYGAQVAAHFGLPYCFAWFFTDGQGARQALRIYQGAYRPSERHPHPHAGICVWALAADSEEEAQHHFTSRAVWRLSRDRGVFLPFEAPEVAAAQPLSPVEAKRVEQLRRESLVGTKEQVAARIRDLALDLSVQEVAVVTWTYDEAVRRRSYELLAQAFGHARQDAPASRREIRRKTVPRLRAASDVELGWYGGKFSHLEWLLPLLPESHHYWPFAGSAAVLLNRDPSPVETYNDMDGDVVNFFSVLRDDSDRLIRAIALTPFSREEFYKAIYGSRRGISKQPFSLLWPTGAARGSTELDAQCVRDTWSWTRPSWGSPAASRGLMDELYKESSAVKTRCGTFSPASAPTPSSLPTARTSSKTCGTTRHSAKVWKRPGT